MISGPELINLAECHLAGRRIQTTLAANETVRLWKIFMPGVKAIPGRMNGDLYSVRIYPAGLQMNSFTPDTPFEEWAAVSIDSGARIPEDLEILLVKAGLYAVFTIRGTAADFIGSARKIYTDWLPASGYDLDDRPHITVMGDSYVPDDPASVEEFWVPVRQVSKTIQ